MNERNFPNRTLYHGDNLDFLKGMNSGTVNLIATDPPFNKNKDFHATPASLAEGARFQDRWNWHEDIHDDWLIAIQKDHHEVWKVIDAAKTVWGDDMGAFLCWLAVRLIEMHRILSNDGSLYLHIDHTAHAWAKCLLDAIFGRRNFRNEIVWCYTGPSNTAKRFPRKHDTILFYAKSETSQFNRDEIRIPYKQLSSGGKGGGQIFTTGHDETRMSKLREIGKIPESHWNDIIPLTRKNKERTGYPTQKPLALYERIIKASSNPDDMVLDPFCGCATTPVAAERLDRQWVGIDIWDGTHEIILTRLEQEGLLSKTHQSQLQQQRLFTQDINFSTTPPRRTDNRSKEVPTLLTPSAQKTRYPAPRTQHGNLLANLGPHCQGCGANYFFDTRVLEVDHINPRSQGGSDAYENLTLLCPPCNKEKRDRYTLIGLQDANRKNGYMKDETVLKQGQKPKRSNRR